MSSSGGPVLTSNVAELQALHHKMAKKVAQLTKVIYLLNTKNDEHEYEITCLESQYESDVSDVLHDAQAKLATLKQRLETKESAELAQMAGGNEKMLKQIEEMKKHHEQEKKHAQLKLEKMKAQATENETLIKNTTKDKLDAMKKEVEEAKTQFLIRMHSFSRVTKTMEAAHATALLDQRNKALKEMEDYVHSSNAKYNQMLAERMNIEEDLRAKLANSSKSAEATKEAEARLQATKDEAAKTLASELAKLTRKFEKELELSAKRLIEEKEARKDDNDKADKQIRELKRQLEELTQRSQAELAELRSANQRDSDQSKRALSDAERRIKDLQTQYDQLLSQSKQGLDANMKEWMREKETLLSQLQARDQDLSAGQQRESTLLKEKQTLQAAVKRLEETITNLNKDLTTSQATLDQLRRTLSDTQSTLKDTQRQLEESRAQLTDLKQSAQGGLSAAQESLSAERAAHARTKDDLETAKHDLLNLKHELTVLQEEDAALLGRYRELQFAHDDLKKEHTQLKTTLTELQAQFTQAQTHIKQLEAEIAALQSKLKHTEGEQGQAFERLKAEKMKLEEENSTLSSDLATSQSLASKLQSQYDALRSEHDTLLAKFAQLQSDFDALQSERSRAAGESDAALKQLQATYTTLMHEHASLQRAKDRLDESLTKLGKMLDAEQAAAKAKELDFNRQLEALRLQYQQEKSSLASAQGEEVARLRQQLVDLSKEHQLKITEMLREQDRLLAQEKAQYESDLARLRADMDGRVDQLEKTWREKLEAEKRRILQDGASKEAHWQQLLQAEKERAARLESEASLHLAQQLQAARTDFETRLAAMKQTYTHERDEMKASYERELQNLKDATSQKQGLLQSELNDTRSKLDATTLKANQLAAELDALRTEHSVFVDRAQRKEAQLLEQHRDALDDADQKARDELSRLMRLNSEELQRLQAQHASNQQSWSQQQQELQRALAALQYRFENREPRPEDVARIRELEEYGIQAEKAKRKAVEDMKYYKLELLNREENFNKTFGRSPMVGPPGAVSLSGGNTTTNLGATTKPTPTNAAASGGMSVRIPPSSTRAAQPGAGSPAVGGGGMSQSLSGVNLTSGATKRSSGQTMAPSPSSKALQQQQQQQQQEEEKSAGRQPKR